MVRGWVALRRMRPLLPRTLNDVPNVTSVQEPVEERGGHDLASPRIRRESSKPPLEVEHGAANDRHDLDLGRCHCGRSRSKGLAGRPFSFVWDP